MREKQKEMTDHDLLVTLNNKVDLMCRSLTNHLEHHFWLNITLLGAFIATITAFGLYLL